MDVLAGQLKDERVGNMMLVASLADDDDCVKFFLCELGSRLEGAVTDFEAMVGGMFDASSSSSSSYDLDSGAAPSAAAPSAAAAAKFRLAAALGRSGGPGVCKSTYGKCDRDYGLLLEEIRGQTMRIVDNEIP